MMSAPNDKPGAAPREWWINDTNDICCPVSEEFPVMGHTHDWLHVIEYSEYNRILEAYNEARVELTKWENLSLTESAYQWKTHLREWPKERDTLQAKLKEVDKDLHNAEVYVKDLLAEVERLNTKYDHQVLVKQVDHLRAENERISERENTLLKIQDDFAQVNGLLKSRLAKLEDK